MKAWSMNESSTRINGSLYLRKSEFAQRDYGQWFMRVTIKGMSSSGWNKINLDFLQETQHPEFWIVSIDGTKFSSPIRLLPLGIAPKFRLPKD